MDRLAKAVVSRLRAKDYEFKARKVAYGKQVRLADGAILTIYDKGTTRWQGEPSKYRERIDKIIKSVAQSLKPRHASLFPKPGEGARKRTKAKSKPGRKPVDSTLKALRKRRKQREAAK